jgi:uncharacterized membrane protein (DUF106 family)
MGMLNSILNRLFDLLFYPFRHLNPWWGMIYISLLTGLLMLAIFRLTSNQAGIKAAKDRIKAHLLEMRLFKDNLRVSLGAQRQILAANLRYIGYSAKPLAVMIIPLLLILAQLNFWFGYRPLSVGEPAILKVHLEKSADPMTMNIDVQTPPAIRLETPPLRLAEQREIDWRIRPQAEGVSRLTVSLAGGRGISKSVAVGGNPLSRLTPLRVRRGVFEEFLNPGEGALPTGQSVDSVEIIYPGRRLSLFGLRLHWLVVYFGLSIILGFVLKRPFKVEI